MKISSKRSLRRFLSGVAVLGVLLAYQNCGGFHEGGSSASSSTASDFAYPYPSSPDYFIEAQHSAVAVPAGAGTFNHSIFVSVARASGDQGPIDYTVGLVDQTGYPICPQTTGTLLAGQSSIFQTCVSRSAQSTGFKVEMTVTVNGVSSNLERAF